MTERPAERPRGVAVQLRQCLRSTGSSDVNEVTGPTGMGPSDLHGVKEDGKVGLQPVVSQGRNKLIISLPLHFGV